MRIRLFVWVVTFLCSVNTAAFSPQQRLERLRLIFESIEQCDPEIPETCAQACPSCDGTGLVPCRFCKGTGFMTVGDQVIGTDNACPACEEGYERCEACKGRGRFATWTQHE